VDADPFESLLERYQSGEATPDDLAALEKLLRGDPEKRRRFVDRTFLEVQLHTVCAGILPMKSVAAPPAARSRRFRLGVLAAAAVLLLATAAFLLFSPGRKQGPSSEVVTGRVRVDGVAVERIPEGARFEVASDTAVVVRLPDGSRAELDASSQGTIRAARVIELANGGGIFQVAHGEGQFRVETPVGTVTALGTEFSVKLRPQKTTAGARNRPILAVKVTAGTVEVVVAGNRHLLSAGTSGDFDEGEQNNENDGQHNNRNDGKQNNREEGGQKDN
jgi:ferric-dicitrate binding protein FerR (iron transport regulator)